eukprot:CAMPEP_0183477424 /NCGR_PEP_ID=MMETSP0370-20130417/168185_1 /TAXON_ID=268820 /ORGANISM="Peridinium aciculiferum, Strain PAER-2" /LENGTH=51 /DNA_ID=CAMNT_0025670325 /DNA_START=59 /DNA_END=211 /DNA_ORIENTATION=-
MEQARQPLEEKPSGRSRQVREVPGRSTPNVRLPDCEESAACVVSFAARAFV